MIQELLRQADAYLVGRVSLRDLETALVSRLQGILDSDDPVAITLTNGVDVDLMRLSDGFISESQFRMELEQKLAQYLASRASV